MAPIVEVDRTVQKIPDRHHAGPSTQKVEDGVPDADIRPMNDAVSAPADRRSDAPSFPGGRVRLPQRSDGRNTTRQNVEVVDTAFRPVTEERPSTPSAPTEGAPRSTFQQYFTYESLFAPPPPEEPVRHGPEDPYKVLRVSPSASWDTIVRAHRLLAKEFHPDRFVDKPDEVQRLADNEIKRINAAYTELRKIHPRG